MRTINHAHLLKAIAAFTRGEQCGFIMPRARGSLRTFWETQDHSMYGSEKMISWLFTQLFGITEGLTKLHEHRYEDKPSTRHRALTPDNILWFPGHDCDPDTYSLGVLIIGDAGGTKGLNKYTGGDRGVRFRYAARELRYAARERFQSSIDDIWSLGLICFEFVIWLIRGNREVQDFRSQTSHVYLSDEDDYQLGRWSSILMTDERCLPGTPLGELLRFISCRLLVWQSEFDRYASGRCAESSEFHSWISELQSTVSANGHSYTAVQTNLPWPGSARPYKPGRERTSESPERVGESEVATFPPPSDPPRRAIRSRFHNLSVPWRRRKGDGK